MTYIEYTMYGSNIWTHYFILVWVWFTACFWDKIWVQVQDHRFHTYYLRTP